MALSLQKLTVCCEEVGKLISARVLCPQRNHSTLEKVLAKAKCLKSEVKRLDHLTTATSSVLGKLLNLLDYF